jgi:hypothetical protein
LLVITDALLNPDTPIVQVLEEWLIAYQATGGEDEEDREEEKRFLAELISFVWRVSLIMICLIWLDGSRC